MMAKLLGNKEYILIKYYVNEQLFVLLYIKCITSFYVK